MIQHMWTVICRDSSVDRDTSNITLFRVFAHLQISLPKPPPNPAAKGVIAPCDFHVVTCWGRSDTGEASSGKARMTLSNPEGETLLVQEYHVDLTQSVQHHQRSMMKQLPLTSGGRYRFCVDRMEASGEWESMTTAPLDVDIRWTDEKNVPYELVKTPANSSSTEPEQKGGGSGVMRPKARI